MYAYNWDTETGGYIMTNSHLSFSKEPRPVYYRELDILGFDKYWNYDKNDTYPYLWAESSSYYYRGRLVAKTKGGSLYTAPELILIDEPESNGGKLRLVDIPAMIAKNENIMVSLVQETIKKIYNTYMEYKDKINVFYVAFSGGKDSVVAFDLVQRALPHNSFKVLFGDTGMEFQDTYDVVDKISNICNEKEIQFYRAKSELLPEQTWELFGPPATTNRWCCSVHKTSPQINILRKELEISNFSGMAFTGVRGAESVSRSGYDDISFGEKHQGQYSCHPILDWNSAELFLYIYANNLVMNEAYKKGNSRAGCLVCPMSSGKHEYMKHVCYKKDVEKYVGLIKKTSGKISFSTEDLQEFVDAGNWKNRRSGRELNFGQDIFVVDTTSDNTRITVFMENLEWLEWAKTIGKIIPMSINDYLIDYKNAPYRIHVEKNENNIEFTFPDTDTTKNGIKFISLFRSVIVKSIYCVKCGACMAECKNNCIDMTKSLSISDKCSHCYKCHEIYEHCFRYNSIRNKIGVEKKMKGIDRYFSFGVRESWMKIFIEYDGCEDFWNTDGNGAVPNKKKDAFLNFVKDANLVWQDKSCKGDKYTKYKPTELVGIIKKLGIDNPISWAIMLVNLAYTPEFNWFIKNIKMNENYTTERVKFMLEAVMENDVKGLGRRNIIDAFKIILIKTPIGEKLGLGHCDYDEKVNSLTLKFFVRLPWNNPDSRIILYALYKFAEECGNYYQFTLTRLFNYDIDSNGISPTEIFGLDREIMEKLLNGLSVNYPEFISTAFTLDLDNINLRSDKTSADVLKIL